MAITLGKRVVTVPGSTTAWSVPGAVPADSAAEAVRRVLGDG